MNLYHLLEQGFPADRTQPAIEVYDLSGVRPRRLWSWQDLEEGSARLANLWRSLGLPPGSRIAAQVDKSVEALLVYLATLRAGYVYLPLNTAYQSAEMSHFIADAQPAVLIAGERQRAWLEPLTQRQGASYFTLEADGTGSLMLAAAEHDTQHHPAAMIGEDLAVILYTSGTTGRSKGAMLTHGNMSSNAQVLRRYWGWSADDVLIHALPIFHIHGLFVAINGALLAGARMLWFERFDARDVIEALPRATLFMGVPTMYVRMLQEASLDASRAAKMRLFISGSAPLLPETHQAWFERTGHRILERYGMSETGMLTSNPYRPDPRYADRSERRPGTVGFPLPGVELRICDAQGQVCAQGEIGGIEVRGPNVFKGYWRMPEKTREEFTADGYFKTGDVGLIDAEGYVSIVGRAKDLIISGGYNVYPAEIESYLNAIPGVAESAVVGVPHPDFGEVGVAVIVARPSIQVDGEAILAQLKTMLANYKIPKRCLVVAELPRNTMGKVQKNLLREQYRALFTERT